jgi:hypothetical protein
MFLGHFGLAYAAKRAAPAASLGSLFLAAQLADLVWPLLLLAGVEHAEVTKGSTPLLDLVFTEYPWTHSLATQCAAGAIIAALYFFAYRRGREALVLGLLVPSHWLLDWFVHVPDLPLYPSEIARHGLGIWQSLPLTLTVEFVLFAGGVAAYLIATRARDGIGRWAAWGLIAFLVLGYLGSTFGSAPSNITALAYSALIMWLLPLWAAWSDRHRKLSGEG